MTATRAITVSITHTATSISGKISAAFQQLLTDLGLHAAVLGHDWADLENALRIWLSERSMKSAKLEIYEKSTGKLVTLVETPVSYSPVDGSASFRNDVDTVRRVASKISTFARGDLAFRVIVT